MANGCRKFAIEYAPRMKITLASSLKSVVSSLASSPGRLLQGMRNQAYFLAMQRQVVGKYGYAKGLPMVPVTALVPGFDEQIRVYTYKPGTSLAVEIGLMKALAAARPGCRFLEIGSYLGEAVANVADTGAECVSLSLGDADMRQLGFGGHIAANRFFIKDNPRIKNIDANTHTYDFSGLGKFDLVFIDGDHTYEGVLNDTEKVVAHCLKSDSIIFWHDYADKSGVRWPVLAALLDGMPEAMRKRVFYIENTLSAIYLPESFALPTLEAYDSLAVPTYSYDIRLTLKPD